nr:ornithine carbamoyltransferase [Nesterenkonia alkaliphila]
MLKETDRTPQQWEHLITLSGELKAAKQNGEEVPRLRGKNIVLLFEKASTRTRCAFEVAAADQGAALTYLDPTGSHLGYKETAKDTARVLGRMYDGIGFRGAGQETVEALAQYSGVPVWNGLTDQWHPTQALCDSMTMLEHTDRPPHQLRFAYLGDASGNMGNSLLMAGALLGADVRIVAPEKLWNTPEVIASARRVAENTGARITHTADIEKGVADADFIHTDVWVSMGEPPETWAERVEQLRPYRVDAEVMKATGNPDVKFMHCLPALHNRETELGRELFERTGLEGLEVTEEVFESSQSIVFHQAENRLHTIKAVMVTAFEA